MSEIIDNNDKKEARSMLYFSIVTKGVTVLLIVFLSLLLFLYTPILRVTGMVGDRGLITLDDAMRNMFPVNDTLDFEETTLRYFMNRYGMEGGTYNAVIAAIKKIDSLDRDIEMWRAYSQNIIDVIERKKSPIVAEKVIEEGRKVENGELSSKLVDSLLREQISGKLNSMNAVSLVDTKGKLFSPMKGRFINTFDYIKSVYYVTIESGSVSPVMSVGEGTVISSMWSPKDGYTMYVQHAGDIVSIYRGLTSPLKVVGDRVNAREAIGSIGNMKVKGATTTVDGEVKLNSLYFELWRGGTPINPELYIIFN